MLRNLIFTLTNKDSSINLFLHIYTCIVYLMDQVHVNHMDTDHQVFQVLDLGKDNTVCRHGIHGLYRLFNISISSALLTKGDNSILLTQAREGDAVCGILYDYLRLEAPVNSQGYE